MLCDLSEIQLIQLNEQYFDWKNNVVQSLPFYASKLWPEMTCTK